MKRSKLPARVSRTRGYLLTHRTLGVFLGFDEGLPLFSNLEPAGRQEAIIFPAELNLVSFESLDLVKESLRHFGPEDFSLLPIKRRNGQMYLPMAECVRLGLAPWCEFPTWYFSVSRH